MSISTSTAGSAKNVSAAERAVLARASKLLANTPGMAPSAALRKAGVTSATKIKQLGTLLRKSRSSNRGAAAKAKTKPAKKPRAGAKTTQLSTSARDERRSGLPGAFAAQEMRDDQPGMNTVLELWTQQQLRWWTSVMRFTPLGILLSMMTPPSRPH